MEHGGDPFGFFGLADQPHPSLFRSAAAFLVITFKAAADNIIPSFSASVDDGDHMIESEIFRGTFFPAILTGVVVSCIDIGPAELHVMEAFPHLHILEEPEYARQFDGKADASNFAIVLGEYFDFALVKQTEGPFPGNDVYRLVSGVQNQRMFHSTTPVDEYNARFLTGAAVTETGRAGTACLLLLTNKSMAQAEVIQI